MKEKIKNITNKILSNYVIKIIIIAFCITLFCDILNQRSLLKAFIHFFNKPLNFLFNMLLILITISLSGLFKKQKFALTLLAFPWVGLAIANFILQCYRNTPLSFVDFLLIPSVATVFNSYLTIFHYLLIILAVGLLVFGFVVLYKKEKPKDRIIKPSAFCSLLVLLTVILVRVPFIKIDAISNNYSNLTKAYQDYGLPYCFVVSVVDRGVHDPEKYDKEEVINSINIINDIMNNLKNNPSSKYTVESETQPNVVFLQLESFMDTNNLVNLNYTKNPNPYFSYLKENYPSGYLTVPSFGAGTANVEFEVMTGLDLDNFGAGEYPYKTVMLEQPTETIAYTLGNKGYYSTVIHNNRASFYDRDDVFPNMGYDRFVSSEFMIDLDVTPVGWFKDNRLSYEIMKALNSTEEADFIYTISVQPHGKYLTDLTGLNIYAEVASTNKDMTEDLINQYTYYINQVYEVDCFLKDLVEQINNYDEPTMLVIYGDHLPFFDITSEDVLSNDLYKSEYVIYTNYDMELEDKDLYAYQLSSYILQNIGCNDGVINRLHQTREYNESYENSLLLLTYDIFSKSKYLWNNVNPYTTKEMELGYNDVIIYDVVNNNGKLTIIGENFNDSSKVYIGKYKQDAKCISSKILYIDIDDLDQDIEITVKQMYKNKVYSQSNTYKFKYIE